MDLQFIYREFGMAAFTLAPTTPEDLLHHLGVAQGAPVSNILSDLHDEEAGFLAARAVSPHWSIAIETNGETGWIRCTPHLMQALSQRCGTVYSTCFTDEGARLLIARDDGILFGLDIHTGNRWGHSKDEAIDEQLAQVGFHPGGLRAMDPRLKDMRTIDRTDVAFAAVSGHTLNSCLGSTGWIGGVAQR
ncbi:MULTISPECIES: hypothetical protein [unclassified Streptomyces]|uniref:hypothetical protein n=1 Tax=unclassified Streptomyces TaxID=2593676 RepID=UPI0033A27F57